MSKTKIGIQNVSLAGESYVLAQLAMRNITGTLTFGNTKSVDILASNPKTRSMFRVEVKTCSTGPIKSKQFNGIHHEWQMDEKQE
ncbi:hypothetical protein HYX14_02910 [Candidatus Woesearchaeota archaeon]|nr:hypothetical protein [Candidatus Woesearchaeota archaeon]